MHIGVNCLPLQPRMGGQHQYFLSLLRELLQHDAERRVRLLLAGGQRRRIGGVRNRSLEGECGFGVPPA